MHHLFRRIKQNGFSSASTYVKAWPMLMFIIVCNCFPTISASEILSPDSLQSLLNISNNEINDADNLINGAKNVFYSNPELAKEYSSKALTIYEKNKHIDGMANSSNIIASCFFILGHYDKALFFYQNAFNYNEELNSSEGMAKNLNNIGNTYFKTGKLEKALEYYFQAFTFYESLDDHSGIITVSTNIGLIYKNTGSFEKALESYNKGLKAAIKDKDALRQGTILYNISLIYIEQKEFFKAKEACAISLEMRNKTNNKSGVIKSLTALGRIHLFLEDYAISNKYFEEALELAQGLNSDEETAEILQYIGYNALEKGDYLTARNYLLQSLKVADNLKLHQLQLSNYNYLTRVDSSMGNFESAMVYQQKYYLLKPVEESFSVEEKLKELQKKYELTRKENIVAGKKLQRSQSLISSLFFFMILLILTGLIIIQQIRLNSQKKITGLTQQNLRSQMNPHFIFNVLNSIQYYILKNDSVASGNYLTKFAKLLRLTLDNSQANLVCINDEIETLKLYLELESMRLENNLEYDIEIDDEIDSFMFKIPTLLLQPFVENSIIHGIQKKEGAGKVHIEMKLKEKAIHCLIEDNGVGREKANELKTREQKGRTSHGSNITQTRLNLLNSLYGKKLGIEYSDLLDDNMLPCGTRVEFDLPILN